MTASFRVSLTGLGLLLGLALSSTAMAQGAPADPNEAEARALFEAGREAFDTARFEAAIGYFQQAYALSPRPQFHFNIASAADRARQDELALEEYRAYLDEVPDAENSPYVEGRIATLEAQRSGADVTGGEPTEPAGSSGDVTGEWWFWLAIGVLVVGAAAGVTAGVLVATAEEEPAYQGSFGPGVVFTLVEGEF